MGTASINGINIGFDDEGHGVPLVLVHGHPFDRSMWRPQVAHFSRSGWRVLAPDLRGYGTSTVVPGKTPLDTFARDIAELMDQLEIEHIILCGLSMGGQITMEFHQMFADRVHGLVFADTSPRAESEIDKSERNAMADRLLREGMAHYADEALSTMVAPHNIRELPAVADHVLAMMRATPAEGAAAALRGRAERPDYVDMLAEIAVPTLVLVGSEDEFTPIAEAEFMHKRIPGSTLTIIEGAAHLPNLERPAEFNRTVETFLDANF